MPTSKHDENVPSGYLTRKMVKDYAGITEYDFKHLEESRVIKPAKKNALGHCLYLETEVLDKIKHRNIGRRKSSAIVYTNEEAAKVFKLLKQNVPLVEIVIETGVHPLAADQIQKDYLFHSKQLIISSDILEKINNLPLDAQLPIKHGYEILELLEELIKEPQCTKCGIRPKGLCTGCAKHSIMRMIAKQALREAQKAEKQMQNATNGKSANGAEPAADDQNLDEDLDTK